MTTSQTQKVINEENSKQPRGMNMPLHYSLHLIELIKNLQLTGHTFYEAGEERRKTIIELYTYAVIESKELTSGEVIDLIRNVLRISRATVYNYLPDEYKRGYTKTESPDLDNSPVGVKPRRFM